MCWKTWRRPTLPRLETQYHGRWGISRPSSGWDRVQAPRHGHQVVQHTQFLFRLLPVCVCGLQVLVCVCVHVWLVLPFVAVSTGFGPAAGFFDDGRRAVFPFRWMIAVQGGFGLSFEGLAGDCADRAIRTS